MINNNTTGSYRIIALRFMSNDIPQCFLGVASIHFKLPPLASAPASQSVGHQYWWLVGGNRTYLEVASMVVTWWIGGWLRSDGQHQVWWHGRLCCIYEADYTLWEVHFKIHYHHLLLEPPLAVHCGFCVQSCHIVFSSFFIIKVPSISASKISDTPFKSSTLIRKFGRWEFCHSFIWTLQQMVYYICRCCDSYIL